jgi:photosystem II stability/assembly factor-like uncharacterized protein
MLFALAGAVLALAAFALIETSDRAIDPRLEGVRSTGSPKAHAESKAARAEYFHKMLRDPHTDAVPKDARRADLAFYDELTRANALAKPALDYNWSEVGPTDVGGRTRGLDVDVRNANVVVAAGVSGGIWKSTDKGSTWSMKTGTDQIPSVTFIAQDKRSGHEDTWYAVGGEYWGNSARSSGAYYYGAGLYKSTDNGESWSIVPGTEAGDQFSWDTKFDYVSRIVVSPTTGSLFMASHAFGVFKSTDGGSSWDLVLGGTNEHRYADVAVNSDGDLLAAVCDPFSGYTPSNTPGIYRSTDDGANWNSLGVTGYPSQGQIARNVIAFAPSNPDIAYIFMYTGMTSGGKDVVKFFKLDLGTMTSSDRSANLPDFMDSPQGYIATQGGYNMTLAVKPDDEDFVLIGATSLFRSTDGFATYPSNQSETWIGGYHPSQFFYPNLHPDVHSFAFEPGNPDGVWFGHDGGLSYTDDVTQAAGAVFPWQNKNNGYNVTQFYRVAMYVDAGDNRVMGGTQDNGTPTFTVGGASHDASSGDGAYCYFGYNYAYTSTQNGSVQRVDYHPTTNLPDRSEGYRLLHPLYATGQLFINPFRLDPNDERVMYYAAGDTIYRNTEITSTPENPNFVGIVHQWEDLENVTAPSTDYVITSMEVSKGAPDHRLYFGASSSDYAPVLCRLDNADEATSGLVTTTVSAETGGWVQDVSVNPEDADEILVVISNYGVTSLFHSTDGGGTFTDVEGSLYDASSGGPSFRCAEILPRTDGTLYLVGTSVGLFSSLQMNGASTSWTPEGATTIGNTVVTDIVSRTSDGKVLVGTHGRGAFTVTLPTDVDDRGETPDEFALRQNYPNPFNPTTTIRFALPEAADVTLEVFSIDGEKVATLIDDARMNAGERQIAFNGADLASGVYIYRLAAGEFVQTRKMTLLK